MTNGRNAYAPNASPLIAEPSQRHPSLGNKSWVYANLRRHFRFQPFFKKNIPVAMRGGSETLFALPLCIHLTHNAVVTEVEAHTVPISCSDVTCRRAAKRTCLVRASAAFHGGPDITSSSPLRTAMNLPFSGHETLQSVSGRLATDRKFTFHRHNTCGFIS